MKPGRKPKRDKRVTLSVVVDPKTRDRIKAEAEATGQSAGRVVDACVTHLDRGALHIVKTSVMRHLDSLEANPSASGREKLAVLALRKLIEQQATIDLIGKLDT